MNPTTHTMNRTTALPALVGRLAGNKSDYCYGKEQGGKARLQRRFPSVTFAPSGDWTGRISIGVWGIRPVSRSGRSTGSNAVCTLQGGEQA